MLAQQRQSAILDLIRQQGSVRVGQLVSEFRVSDMTIRRDLESLAERGLVAKVHGGATLSDHGSSEEPGFAAKSVRQQPEKQAIAERAAALVEPGMAIALSAGTTTAALATFLTGVPGLTVLTNSIPVADALYQHPRTDQTVVLTGGIRTPSDALTGPVAEAAINAVNVDLLFLGIHGMSLRTGFTTPNLLEAGINRRLISAARRLVVLADHTKWDTIGIATIAPLEDADVLITDAKLSPDIRAQIINKVGELIVVTPAGSPSRIPR